ncbi:MAG: hypothetical protein ABIS86_06225 [Streptosporangiaceae bacterium]
MNNRWWQAAGAMLAVGGAAGYAVAWYQRLPLAWWAIALGIAAGGIIVLGLAFFTDRRAEKVAVAASLVTLILTGLTIREHDRDPAPARVCQEQYDTLKGRPQAVALTARRSLTATFDSVSYTLTTSDPDPVKSIFRMQAVGRQHGPAPAGHSIYLVYTGDPDGARSVINGRGTANYFARAVVTAGPDGCWSIPEQKLGAGAAQGLLFKFSFMAVPDDRVADLERIKDCGALRTCVNNGFSPAQFDRWGIYSLADFDIQT